MIKQGIRIFWDNSFEDIEFDFDRPESILKIATTSELWNDREVVTYNVNPAIKKISTNTFEITIKYSKEMNPDIDPSDVVWGESNILIDTGKLDGFAEWANSENENKIGNGKSRWERIGVLQRKRKKVTSTQSQREQTKFRERLLELDQSCVLTGETTKDVLEAAHIISVLKEGVDLTSNGIILRCDLHRLYDNGKFKILESGEVVIISNELSSYYKKLLTAASIEGSTLTRIKNALVEKSLEKN